MAKMYFHKSDGNFTCYTYVENLGYFLFELVYLTADLFWYKNKLFVQPFEFMQLLQRINAGQQCRSTN